MVSWVTRTIVVGNRKELESEDIPPLDPEERTNALGHALHAHWSKEMEGKGRRPSLLKATFRTFSGQYFSLVLLGLLANSVCK